MEKSGNQWIVETPDGPLGFRFVPENGFGVLDHFVCLAPGVEVLNPMRVVPNGLGCEVTFTLFQAPGRSDRQYAEDAAMVARDLRTLKSVLEGERLS